MAKLERKQKREAARAEKAKKRQEAAESQMQMVNSRPELLNIIGDILFKNMDTPGSDEISKRLATMLPPEIKQLQDQDEDADPKVLAMMEQMDQAMAQIEEFADALERELQDLGEFRKSYERHNR